MLFSFSPKYFREPQMKPTEADEPGSLDYNHRLWRRNRNEKIISETQPQKERAGFGKWDTQVGLFNNNGQPRRLMFHQFENHMVAVDDRDGIAYVFWVYFFLHVGNMCWLDSRIWDWTKGVRLNHFSNGNPAGTRITDIKFLNEDDVALLLTGSADGVVRIYKNYESQKKVELLN